MSETLLNEPGQTVSTQSAGEGVGESLRRARQQKGLSLEEAGRLVKLQARTLETIENEDWSSLGPEVFVRGHLRSYGRAMQVDVEPFLESLANRFGRPVAAPVVLKGQGGVTFSPDMPAFHRSLGRPFVWIVLIVLLLAGAWILLPDNLKPEAAPPVAASLDALPPPPPVQSPPVATAEPEPSAAVTPSPAPTLTLQFKAESWVHIIGADGRTLEQGVLPAGQTRSYGNGEVGRLVLGNASEVEVQQAGVTVDTTPFRRANVARFAVSSDGSLAPLVD